MVKTKAYLHNENGEVMLESTLVMVLTLFVLIAMISVGFLFYQQAMLNTIASDVATDIATAYKLTSIKIGNENYSSDALEAVHLYRTSLAVGKMKTLHKARANEYLAERVKVTTLGVSEKEPVVEDLDVVIDNIGRMHVEVTVSMECEIPFGNALVYFGFFKSAPKFTASASAECLDITAYASHVEFIEYLNRKLEDSSNLKKTLDTVLGIFQDANSIEDMLFGK